MFQWHNGRGYVEESSGSDRGGVKSLFELERKIFFNFVLELKTKIRSEMKRKNEKNKGKEARKLLPLFASLPNE